MECRLQLEELVADDLDAAAALSAEAFLDSRPYEYAFGEATSRSARRSLLQLMFAKTFALRLKAGACHCARDSHTGLVGFLLFVPPEVPNPSICEMFRSGYMRCFLTLGMRPTMRLMNITSWAERVEEEILKGRPVIRIEGISVSPSRQGCGIGSSILRKALEDADRRGLEVFAATQEELSVPFYKRLGFELVREEVFDPGGFRGWFLLRPPAVHMSDGVVTDPFIASVGET